MRETPAVPKVSRLESLLKDMQNTKEPPETIAATPAKENGAEEIPEETPEEVPDREPSPRVGYIVFLSAILLSPEARESQ